MSRVIVVLVASTLLVQAGHATLSVTAVPEQCAKATAMELWRKSSEPIPHDPDQPTEMLFLSVPSLGRGTIKVWFTRIDRQPIGSECRWSYPDLPAGDYIARLIRPDGSGGSQESKLSAGTPQAIEIPAPTVTLSGLVTLDGMPHGGEIQIRDRSWAGPTTSVTADAAGHYTAMLDRPAAYDITVRASARGAAEQVVQLHEGLNQLEIAARTPTEATSDVGLASLTVPERALPDGCRLRPYVPYVPASPPAPDGRVTVVAVNPESLPGNPWIGFNRQVLISLLGTTPVPDGPPLTVREMRAMQSESLRHVREGYRAIYESAEGSAVDIRAVRFDDAKQMPTTLAVPRQVDRTVDDEFAIGAIFVHVATRRETACSRAIDAYLRALK